jgi:hypothetical protein
MDNFDLKKFLVENKLTVNSRLLEEASTQPTPEQAATLAAKAVGSLENDPAINKAADAIVNNPKALEQLKSVLGKAGINTTELSENVDSNLVQKLALVMAKKSQEIAERLTEPDFSASPIIGLIGGGILGNIIGSMGDVVYTAKEIIMGAPNPSHTPEIVIGAIVGMILAVIAQKVYNKIEDRSQDS